MPGDTFNLHGFRGPVPVTIEIKPETGDLGDEVTSEGWSPALLQDRPLHALNAAVGLRSAGPDEDVVAVATPHSSGDVRGAELARVVGHDLLEAPAAPNEILGDPAGERRGAARRRVLGCDVNLGPGVARRHVDRRVLPRGSLDARQPTDIEAVHRVDVPDAMRDLEEGNVRGKIAISL